MISKLGKGGRSGDEAAAGPGPDDGSYEPRKRKAAEIPALTREPPDDKSPCLEGHSAEQSFRILNCSIEVSKTRTPGDGLGASAALAMKELRRVSEVKEFIERSSTVATSRRVWAGIGQVDAHNMCDSSSLYISKNWAQLRTLLHQDGYLLLRGVLAKEEVLEVHSVPQPVLPASRASIHRTFRCATSELASSA
mmetsp:Transcript_7369/g.20806  ORF Transcript_7369/g.20806 Transcript_7369/m.20806 type:complete len:194 (-) Transcript_7369:45-626(-)